MGLEDMNVFVKIPSDHKFKSVNCGELFTITLDNEGFLWGCGQSHTIAIDKSGYLWGSGLIHSVNLVSVVEDIAQLQLTNMDLRK
jgi:alpha-tubulin suppressor-like RCC1 family protein